MSEYINGYRTGKSEAYAIAALIVRKVGNLLDAAELLEALAANETNSSTVDESEGED